MQTCLDRPRRIPATPDELGSRRAFGRCWPWRICIALVALLLGAGCSSSSSSSSGSDATTGADVTNGDTLGSDTTTPTLPYFVNSTNQTLCFGTVSSISCPTSGTPFFGQDSQTSKGKMKFVDNGDGTVTDSNTGLMWVADHGEKMTWNEAVDGAKSFDLAGYSDWRLPTIKELYSLIDFRGGSQMTEATSVPYIDTSAFSFIYGDSSKGERLIDAQYWSATKYVHLTMSGDPTAFGVNFADGRIKGYPITTPQGAEFTAFVKYVRGNSSYGQNQFVDPQDGTVRDDATGLVWQKADNGQPISWEAALAYCEGLDLAGYSDWRLPNAKELQSIVDYTRSPKTTNSAAIDPVFDVTEIESYYWSSTTHKEGPTETQGKQAIYVCFGRALGYIEQPMNSGTYQLLDVHGAGAQRSDPKEGDPSDYPHGFGPQGDDIRIYNYVRCVRNE